MSLSPAPFYCVAYGLIIGGNFLQMMRNPRHFPDTSCDIINKNLYANSLQEENNKKQNEMWISGIENQDECFTGMCSHFKHFISKRRIMKHIKRIALMIGICFIFMAIYKNNPEMMPRYDYIVTASAEVNGRQGVAVEGEYYWVSGSASLAKYDKNWDIIAVNHTPFATGYTQEVNHIGDIDVYNNEIYCGIELFLDGVSKNIQIAIYDGDTLELKRSFPFQPESGQEECSGIAVNPDNQTVCMSVWAGNEAGKYLYQYNLKTGEYIEKIHIKNAPPFIQGVAYYEGYYYISADDGDANLQEPDHIYRMNIFASAQEVTAIQEHTFDDVTMQGEIEGLSFDHSTKQFLLLYNRGAKIVNGMPAGFYDGYDHEIHEVFLYHELLGYSDTKPPYSPADI